MPAKKSPPKSITSMSKTPPAPPSIPPGQQPFIVLSRQQFIIALGVFVLLLVGLGYIFKNRLITASVNGKYITRSAYLKALEAQAGPATLNRLITEELILAEADKQSVTVSPETVDAEVESLRQKFSAQEQDLDTMLLQEGMTLDSLKQQIYIQQLITALTADQTAATEKEIQTYLDQNQDSLPTTLKTDEEKQTFAKTQLTQQKQQQHFQTWLEDLRQSAAIIYW